MLGQGELYYKSVNIGVGIERVDGAEEFVLGYVVLVAYECGFESAHFAGFNLVGYICLGAAVVSDEDGGEVGALFAVGEQAFCLLRPRFHA